MVKLANLFPERLHNWVTGELLARQFSLRSEVRGQECSHAGVTVLTVCLTIPLALLMPWLLEERTASTAILL